MEIRAKWTQFPPHHTHNFTAPGYWKMSPYARTGIGATPQWVKCLLGKHENLIAGPQAPIYMMEIVVHVYNPRTGEERDISGAPWFN